MKQSGGKKPKASEKAKRAATIFKLGYGRVKEIYKNKSKKE